MDAKYIINLSGRDYPLFAGILNEAHERGLQSIETQLIQIPSAENDNTAVVKAVVTMKDGTRFEDYGDASPRNCSARVATALIRMASTRSKGRALRDAINVGQTMLEELPDLEEHGPSESAPRAHAVVYRAAPQTRSLVAEPPARAAAAEAPAAVPAAAANGDGKPTCSAPDCGKGLTKGQYDVSMQRFGQPLCPSCQKGHVKAG
jgi:hypothetical protein